jgi:hypothetical protein
MKYVKSLCTKVSEELQISTQSEDPLFTDTVIIGKLKKVKISSLSYLRVFCGQIFI